MTPKKELGSLERVATMRKGISKPFEPTRKNIQPITGPLVKPSVAPVAPQVIPNVANPKIEALKTAMRGTPTMKKGGLVGSASKRADGCATKGKTKGRII